MSEKKESFWLKPRLNFLECLVAGFILGVVSPTIEDIAKHGIKGPQKTVGSYKGYEVEISKYEDRTTVNIFDRETRTMILGADDDNNFSIDRVAPMMGYMGRDQVENGTALPLVQEAYDAVRKK